MELKEHHHFVRYCHAGSKSKSTGTPTEAAFKLRPNINETYLSVDWLEYFHSESEKTKVQSVLKALNKRHRGNKNGGIMAVLNVGTVTEEIKTDLDIAFRLKKIKKSYYGAHYDTDKHLEVAIILSENIKSYYPIDNLNS